MLRRLWSDERGEAAETVLVTPVLLFLVMLIFQFGLWYHAEHIAQAAAREGVRSARFEDGTEEDGQRRAKDFLVRAGASLIGDPVVTAHRDDETAVVEVRGRSVAVVPGLRFAVRARSESPVERYRP